MSIAPTHRPIVGQARVGIRGAQVPARTVRVGVASPSQGPNSIPEEKRSPGVQTYLTEAVRSVFQTETGKDVKFKSPQWVQPPIPSQAAQSLLKLPLLALPAPKDGVTEVPPSFKRYVVQMLEKAAASKDADATEPKWKVNEFKGRISHRHNGDHHDH